MFLVPLLAGIIVADSVTMESLLFAFGSLALFLAHHPLESVFRAGARAAGSRQMLSWGVALFALGALPLAALIVRGHSFLVPIGLLAASAAVVRFRVALRSGRSLLSDLIGVAGLCLTPRRRMP
jgi:hypothetical protein